MSEDTIAARPPAGQTGLKPNAIGFLDASQADGLGQVAVGVGEDFVSYRMRDGSVWTNDAREEEAATC